MAQRIFIHHIHRGMRPREGYRESRRCSRDTHPESCITKYTSIRRSEMCDLSTRGWEFRNVKRFRGGLVFKAHRRLYHSTPGLRVIKKKKTKVRDSWMSAYLPVHTEAPTQVTPTRHQRETSHMPTLLIHVLVSIKITERLF